MKNYEKHNSKNRKTLEKVGIVIWQNQNDKTNIRK